MAFMDSDFLLKSDVAKKLYHEYAKKMPIIDYHCHIEASDIANDVRFSTITEVWLSGDHYKWRLMRTNGVDERFITGDADDYEKFYWWAKTLERAVGNPLYHWSHLELQRYFHINEPLTSENAASVYERCNEVLKEEGMSARGLILRSNVRLLCTTDDPADDLRYHKQLKEDTAFPVTVLPAFRPDNIMYIEKDGFCDYVKKLGSSCDTEITDLSSLLSVLENRMLYFRENGCKVADHGLSYVMYNPCTEEEANRILKKKLSGGAVTASEELSYKTFLLTFFGKAYHRHGFVLQLHYGVKRDNNTRVFRAIGANTGFDCIDNYTPIAPLSEYLNHLALTEELPKTILYSLNPIDNAAIDALIGCFQDSTAAGKIQHGAAWWFNDNKDGMISQMTSLMNLGSLNRFIGMLTDSRSFLSYTRHEYFRRILCELIGSLVENGEYPEDYTVLGSIVSDICYNNCNTYFDFKLS